MLECDDHCTYTYESALTRRMWYSTVTPTDPDMRRVSWGQSAQTTTREVSFALSLVDTHELRRDSIYIYIVQSVYIYGIPGHSQNLNSIYMFYPYQEFYPYQVHDIWNSDSGNGQGSFAPLDPLDPLPEFHRLSCLWELHCSNKC